MRSRFTRSVHFAAGAVALWTVALPSRAQDTPSTYEERVRPVLLRNCSGCHVSGGHAGGLKMDTYAEIRKGGGRGPTVVPGDPAASLLSKAIHYGDDVLKMPPRGKIADADIAVIDKWIAEGAVATGPATVTSAPKAEEAAVAAPAAEVAAKMEPAPQSTADQEKFFETRIRPLFAKNCYACHTSPPSAGLRLDSREAVMKGGKDGAVVVPGHPESSLLVTVLKYNGKIQMPPRGPLENDDVAAVEQWIRDGAPWPKNAPVSPTSRVTPEQRGFWSFHAPSRPVVPDLKSAWVSNDIDRFVLAKLQEKHLKPVADADKRTLIRRVTYDLTGLPPTPAEIKDFLDDSSAGQYEKMIDRLLASKAYGERWGRKWLDVVRYADTDGGSGDFPIPQAYKYRDYVIRSFNEDKPYDRFIREQLAGDLLPSKSEPERWQNIVATGYLASAVRADGKPGYLSDTVDNLGSAFLGVTVGCARCHDHKFDPVPTNDYYALYGIFASTRFPDSGVDGARYQRGFVFRDPEVVNREEYKTFQAQLKPIQRATEAVMGLPGTYDDLVPQLQARRMHLYEHKPDFGETAYAVVDDTPQDARVHRYGDPRELGDEAPRGFLQVLGGGPLPADTKGSGRLELANWIASKDNPLTARVIVNRIWQGHFARGIVSTPNDFGSRGAAPSNQALLDYLAWKLVDGGWSIKSLHKEILLSHAYRLSSAGSAANEDVDPENAFIWRHSRVRLDSEQIRDSLLADSQLLDRTPAKAHPFPPESVWNYEQQNMFSPNHADYETDRRTVYQMVQRTVRSQYFTLFDGPNINMSTDQRGASLTPLQALYFMNAPFPRRCATNLASILTSKEAPEKDMVQQAFLTIYGRPSSQAEMDRSLGFLHSAADSYATHGAAEPSPKQKAFEDFLKALFASNEFMFIE
ncbi:MAG: PSD1 and planctomycete cytochrome C domain-containing protein [Bryobacteraceae bacterium]